MCFFLFYSYNIYPIAFKVLAALASLIWRLDIQLAVRHLGAFSVETTQGGFVS